MISTYVGPDENSRILTGMILWEAYLENPESFPGIEAAREQHGSCELRDRFMRRLIDAADEVFHHACEAGYDLSFDFDFAETFLRLLTDATDAESADTAPMLRIKGDDYKIAGQMIAMRCRASWALATVERGLRDLCGPQGKRPDIPASGVWPFGMDQWPVMDAA